MSKLDGKIVRFLAVDRKYRSTPYPAVAPYDTKLNTYITGQHFIAGDKERSDFLTVEEITGEMEIKPAKRKDKFRYVINDEDPIMIVHNKPYDCRLDANGNPVNNKDYWDAHFILAQTDLVAMSKASSNAKHKFHLDDREAEAKEFVIGADEVYEAEKLIREKASIEEYKEIVMLLNLYVKDFNVDWKPLNSTRLKALLIKQARSNPKSIKFAFSKTGKDYLFIAKLTAKKIITKKTDGYYDGEKFVALDTKKLVAFIQDKTNDEFVSKWGRLLKESNS